MPVCWFCHEAAHLLFLREIHAFNAKSVDPDRTKHSAASDLGLHCLPRTFFRDAKHYWVKWALS